MKPVLKASESKTNELETWVSKWTKNKHVQDCKCAWCVKMLAKPRKLGPPVTKEEKRQTRCNTEHKTQMETEKQRWERQGKGKHRL